MNIPELQMHATISNHYKASDSPLGCNAWQPLRWGNSWWWLLEEPETMKRSGSRHTYLLISLDNNKQRAKTSFKFHFPFAIFRFKLKLLFVWGCERMSQWDLRWCVRMEPWKEQHLLQAMLSVWQGGRNASIWLTWPAASSHQVCKHLSLLGLDETSGCVPLALDCNTCRIIWTMKLMILRNILHSYTNKQTLTRIIAV